MCTCLLYVTLSEILIPCNYFREYYHLTFIFNCFQEGYIIPDNPDGTRARRSCAQKNKDYSFPSMEWYVEQDSKTEP